MRILRTLTIAAAAVAALASSTLTGTALAAPSGCVAIINPIGHAWCTKGSGFVRVKVTCSNDYTKKTIVYGPWKSTPNPSPYDYSHKRCPDSHPHHMKAEYETKS
ncbi:hypothetical protein [Streptosporangium sp. NPDC049078]|uniref:hypothetical protein n=1 Tax=Streptosporangium sp. NPDC049078 TaxID=3155767 RepID=UPI003420521A